MAVDSGESTLPGIPADVEHLRETLVRSERVFDGHFANINRDTVRLANGHETSREYFVHPGAVMMIPLLEDGRVVLERQWRYPLARAFIEFPAGKIDPDEPPLATVVRELKEETGYVAGKISYLCTINNAISYSTENIFIYLAEELIAGVSELDEDELLDVFAVPASQVLDWVKDGTITDVKTIIGAFWLEKIIAGKWQPPSA